MEFFIGGARCWIALSSRRHGTVPPVWALQLRAANAKPTSLPCSERSSARSTNRACSSRSHHFGPRAMMIPFFGKKYVVNTALRQHYLAQPDGQLGRGHTHWALVSGTRCRSRIPVSYLFINANPDGSLQANVTSSTISTLSNLEMEKMLEDRHSLSRTVRRAVSPLSEQWGYQLGSVYIRKVEFTDVHMVQNITEKVVKRLVQVTSAMKQDGDNRVGLIKSETAFGGFPERWPRPPPRGPASSATRSTRLPDRIRGSPRHRFGSDGSRKPARLGCVDRHPTRRQQRAGSTR